MTFTSPAGKAAGAVKARVVLIVRVKACDTEAPALSVTLAVKLKGPGVVVDPLRLVPVNVKPTGKAPAVTLHE